MDSESWPSRVFVREWRQNTRNTDRVAFINTETNSEVSSVSHSLQQLRQQMTQPQLQPQQQQRQTLQHLQQSTDTAAAALFLQQQLPQSTNKDIVNYTYKHDTLGHFSYIDYFMVSTDLVKDVHNFDIIDNALNLSDHNPISILLSLTVDNIPSDTVSSLHR